jgi:mono/diheme cytochrome c family protein
MPTATRYASWITALAVATFVLSLLAWMKPRKLHLALSLLIALSALATMGSFEFIREALRKPYVIAGYMYGNSLYVTPDAGDGGFTVESIDQAGVLTAAKWVEHRSPTDSTRLAAGKEIFRVECQSCHTQDKYRGLKQYLQRRGWNEATMHEMLGSLDLMHNGAMPPFAGTKPELDALTAFLAGVRAVSAAPGPSAEGRAVFDSYCAPCHQFKLQDSLFTRLRSMDAAAAESSLQDLRAIFVRMPQIRLSPQERTALSQWARQRAFSGE